MTARYYQRGIRRFETKLDESGVALIVAAHLTCGHRIAYKRRRPADSKRTAMPCPECGAGPRTPWEEARDEADIERVIQVASRNPVRGKALAMFLRLALEACSTCPITEEQRRIWDRIEVHARTSGLRDRDQAGLHERGPRSMTKAQRDALVSMGRG